METQLVASGATGSGRVDPATDQTRQTKRRWQQRIAQSTIVACGFAGALRGGGLGSSACFNPTDAARDTDTRATAVQPV